MVWSTALQMHDVSQSKPSLFTHSASHFTPNKAQAAAWTTTEVAICKLSVEASNMHSCFRCLRCLYIHPVAPTLHTTIYPTEAYTLVMLPAAKALPPNAASDALTPPATVLPVAPDAPLALPAPVRLSSGASALPPPPPS